MTWKSRLGALCPFLFAAAIGVYPSSADAVEGVVVMFDRSGSMRGQGTCNPAEIGVPTPSKAECGIFGLFNGSTPRLASYIGTDARFFFWEFHDDGVGDFVDNVDTPSGVPGVGAVLPSTNMNATQMNAAMNVALNNLAASPVVAGPLTPLAQTYCRAVTWITKQPGFDTRTIFIVSDGFQEPVVASQLPDCNGPDSTNKPANDTFPNLPYFVLQDSSTNYFLTEGTNGQGDLTKTFLDVGSWMANMFDVGISGGLSQSPNVSTNPIGTPANQPSLIAANHPFPTQFSDCTSTGICTVAFTAPSGGLLTATSVQFIQQFTASGLAFAGGGGGGDTDDGGGEFQTLAAGPPDFLNFLAGLANVGGGRMVVDNAGPGDPFGTHLIQGDINDDGVVNLADFNLLKLSFGQSASANPAAAAADVNIDGTVNDADYRIIKQKFAGTPIFGPVLFGFGHKPDWVEVSSGTFLSATTTRDEGTQGLQVGALNYREFKTVNFNTARFAEVGPSNKTKLLVDVFLPLNPPNPSWLGDVHLLVNCPSAGLFNVFVGVVGLTPGGVPGTFKKNIQFNLPTNVRNAMNTSHSDFSFSLVVNSGNYTNQVVDNVHFL